MLNTIIVDDSSICANMLYDVCNSLFYLDVHCFTNPVDAVNYSQNTKVNIAFLDIDMPEINGLKLSQILKNINPNTYLICVSANEDSCKDATCLNIDKYIFKPFNIAALAEHIEKAFSLNSAHSVTCVKTADGFNFFCGDTPIEFSCKKAKELFSLCISFMGDIVDFDTAVANLWPDKCKDEKLKKLYRKTTASIKSTLSKYTDVKVFGNNRTGCYIFPEEIKII